MDTSKPSFVSPSIVKNLLTGATYVYILSFDKIISTITNMKAIKYIKSLVTTLSVLLFF